MIPPTKEQARTLEAIRKLTVDGVPPSYSELAAELGLASKSGIHRQLNGLRERGLVAFEYGLRRSVRIVDPISGLNLAALTAAQLTTLRTRIETELVGRWKL